MCLDLNKNSKRVKAEKDVVVYKILKLKRNQNNEKVYFTPYQYRNIVIGETYQSRLCRNQYCRRTIDYGLHSFMRKVDAENLVNRYRRGYRDCVIVRCIIPCGGLYYQGEFGYYKSIASNILTYEKIVKRFTFKTNEIYC